MKTAYLVLAATTLTAWAGSGFSAQPNGAYVRPAHPIYRPGYPGVRPGYPGYWLGYGAAYRPGWYGGYWGSRGGYYGSPAYWGAWPYAAAWGFGLGGYAVGYPYVTTPVVINTVPQAPLYVEAQPAAVEAVPQAAPPSYWYYCIQPAGYFPYVKDCSQPWLKVVPQAPGEQATPPQLVR